MTRGQTSTAPLRDVIGRQLPVAVDRLLVGRLRADGSMRARRTALKRAARGSFGEDIRGMRAVLELIQVPSGEGLSLRDEGVRRAVEDASTVLTMFALTAPQSRTGDGLGFARAARSLRASDNERDWVSRQFEKLLQTDRDHLNRGLYRIARMLGTETMAKVSPTQLYYDLGRWDWPDRRVQASWGFDLWSNTESEIKKQKETEGESDQ